MNETLDQIGLKHGTDKASNGHNYLTMYENVMGDRHRPVTVLEIGVYEGASLATWDAWFDHPGSTIVGVDIKSPQTPLAPGAIFVRGDATSTRIVDWVGGYGPFDFIIDDGSHLSPDVIASFELLWPLVAPGGYYIVEDLHVAYLPAWRGVNDPYGPDLSSMHYLKHLTDEVHRGHDHAGPTFARRTTAQDVGSVAFHPGVCVIQKLSHTS